MLKFLGDKKGQVEDWTDFLIAFLILLFIIVIIGFVINLNEDKAKSSINEIGIGNILMTDLMAYLKTPVNDGGNIGDLIILTYYDENIDDKEGYEAKLEEETNKIFSKLNPGCWVIKFHYFLDKEVQLAYEDISLFGEPIGFIETRLPIENGYVDIEYSTTCVLKKEIEYISVGSGS